MNNLDPKKNCGRTVIIGDVHGCHNELEDLLDRIDVNPSVDNILFIGDLINKGPNSLAVVERYRSLQATSLLGNHELRLRNQADGLAERDGNWKRTQEEFGKDFDTFIEDIRGWKPFARHGKVLAVHAGLVPGQEVDISPESSLVNIRTWDDDGLNLQAPHNPPWFDFYHGRDLVVFGHWAALGGLERENVVGIDTGCVYGNRLTALILPDRQLISTPARKSYCPIH